MIFPFPKLWSDPEHDDAVARIDRHLADRTQRLSAGISLSSDFATVHGVLLITSGRGKYLRVNHVANAELQIPDSISNSFFRQLLSESGSNIAPLAQTKSDLAEFQAQVAEQIKVKAGKYVDRLLTVAVNDPGCWSTDFDSHVFYSSLCDTNRLSEMCGLNVIDAFPARDLAVGGNGKLLEAMPLWLLFADRSPRVAKSYVAVFRFDSDTTVFLLPPSDGLDAEVPDIRSIRLPGIGFIRKLVATLGTRTDEIALDLAAHYVGGQRIPQLIDFWSSQFDHSKQQSRHPFRSPNEMVWNEEELVAKTSLFLESNSYSVSSIVRSAIAFAVELIRTEIKHQAGVAATERKHLDRIWISAEEETQAVIINQAHQTFKTSEIQTTTQLGLTNSKLSAVAAALMGLMHVDQMASNIPWLTGANCLRALGQLTPGRPSNWRQLVMDMADFQPPAMKLRDAI